MTPALELLDSFGQWLASRMWQVSLELLVLGVVVYATIHLLRIKSPAMRYLFWCLVLVKPVASFVVSSPVSLYSFLPQQPPEDTVSWSPPAIVQSISPQVTERAVVDISHAQAQEFAEPVHVPPIATDLSMAETPLPIPSRSISGFAVLAIVWLIISSVFLLRIILGFAYVTFLRQTASVVRTGPLADIFAEAESVIHPRRRVRVAVSAIAHGPVLAGVIRPTILLPNALVESFSPEQLKLVIASRQSAQEGGKPCKAEILQWNPVG